MARCGRAALGVAAAAFAGCVSASTQRPRSDTDVAIIEDVSGSPRGEGSEPGPVVRERMLVHLDVAQVLKALEAAAQSMGVMGSRRGGMVFLLAAGEDAVVSIELAQEANGTRIICDPAGGGSRGSGRDARRAREAAPVFS